MVSSERPSTTVADSLPVATVVLNPGNPTTNQILTATATTSDADNVNGVINDVVTLMYVWSRTDPVTGMTSVIQTTGPTTNLTDSLNLSQAGNGGAGAGISVQVKPFDGEFFGSAVTASTTIAAATPVAQDTSISISHNDANYPNGATIPLTATDADPGQTLTYSLYTANGTLTNGGAADGTVTINPMTGVATYTPTGTTIGTDSFQFVASNGTLTSLPATVTVTLTNTPPSVANHIYNVTENTPFPLTALLTGAQDADNDPLTVVLNVPLTTSDGTITLQHGVLVYTPNSGFTGVDSFSYQASDLPSGLADSSNVGTVTLSVQDTAPVANNVTYPPFTEGTTLTVNMAANGLIVAGNDTSFNGVALKAQIVTQGQHGIAVVNPDGTFTYNPTSATFVGTDSFTYDVSDGTLTSLPATVFLTISSVVQAPTANPDSYTAIRNVPLTVTTAAQGVLANDTPATGVTVDLSTITQPTYGTVAMNADGTFTYTPLTTATLPAGTFTDSFTYQAQNSTGLSNFATVTITVNTPVPVANPDTYPLAGSPAVLANGTLTITTAAQGVLANDTDAANDTLTAVDVTQPKNGTVTLNSDGTFTYTNDGTPGPDSFTYTANDGTIPSLPATVTINVTEVPATAVSATFNVPENDTLYTAAAPGVLTGATNVDGKALTAVLDQLHGSRHAGAQPQRLVHLQAEGGFHRPRLVHLLRLRRHPEQSPGHHHAQRPGHPDRRRKQDDHPPASREHHSDLDGGAERADGCHRRQRDRVHRTAGRVRDDDQRRYGRPERQRLVHLHAQDGLHRPRQLQVPGNRRHQREQHRHGEPHGQFDRHPGGREPELHHLRGNRPDVDPGEPAGPRHRSPERHAVRRPDEFHAAGQREGDSRHRRLAHLHPERTFAGGSTASTTL